MSKKITLTTLGSGVLSELFEEDFGKVLRNIADENTKADAIRELTIRIKIKPSKDRGVAVVEVTSNAKLAPIKPFESMAFFQAERGGAIGAYEQERVTQPELDIKEATND